MSDVIKQRMLFMRPCALHDLGQGECCNRLVKKINCDLLRRQQATNDAARFYAHRASMRLRECQQRLNMWSRGVETFF